MKEKASMSANDTLESTWISDNYLNDETFNRLQDWFKNDNSGALSLLDFLDEDKATLLFSCLNKVNLYTDYCSLYWGNTTKEYKHVDRTTFDNAPEESKFGSHLIIRPLDKLLDPMSGLSNEERLFMRSFFEFLFVSDEFRNWISILTEQELEKKITLEFFKYRKDDFLSPHSDCHDRRIIGLNIYLDPNWNKTNGGNLFFKNGKGKISSVQPQFNSLSLIKIDPTYEHWVDQWTVENEGRHGVSISFSPKELNE